MTMSATPLLIVTCRWPGPGITPTPLATRVGGGAPPFNVHALPVTFTSGACAVSSVPVVPAKLSCTSSPGDVVADEVVNDQTGPGVVPVALRAVTRQK